MALGNRKAAEEEILKGIAKFIPTHPGNVETYKEYLSNMNDKEFDAFIKRLNSEEEELFIVSPNLAKDRISIETNFKIAKEWGIEFFQKIWINEGNDIPPYLSNKKYLVCDPPIRRVSQLLREKISVAKDLKSIDKLTGQPTGKRSKTTTVSYPETQILAAMELNRTIEELLKYRGGDQKGLTNMLDSINKQGGVSLNELNKVPTKVKSTMTLKTLLTCMHLSNTL